MRANTLKQKLAAGRRVCGVLVDVTSEDLVEVFGHLGFDFAVLDAQHGGVDPERARGLLRAAELTGLATLVRVPRNDASVILRYLDAGAGGIIVPNVMTGPDVAAAVSAMKYPPAGRRGAAGRSRAAGYGLTQSPAEWFGAANAEVLFMPLVEDPEALDHLAAICGTAGVDAVLAGPGDLSLAMGVPGGFRDPRVQAAVERIRAAAVAAGRPALTLATDADAGRALYAQGFQGLIVAPTGLLVAACRDFLERVGRS